MADCNLCNPDLEPALGQSPHWKLILNQNQNLLGKCFLVLRRHSEQVAQLSADEWMDLHAQIKRGTEMLKAAFKPDHFNLAFLQNRERHVHLHIIPRYAKARSFGGQTFTDRDYPSHYAYPTPDHHLPPEELLALADHLRERLPAD